MKFVRDEPSAALVNHLAKVYRKHDTEIAPVLRALVASREFQRSAGAKVRDPGEDIVASYRALGIRMDQPALGRRRRQRPAVAGREHRHLPAGLAAARRPADRQPVVVRRPRG